MTGTGTVSYTHLDVYKRQVYTGYTYTDPTSNPAGNEMVTITVYDITEEQIKTYIDVYKRQNALSVLRQHG